MFIYKVCNNTEVSENKLDSTFLNENVEYENQKLEKDFSEIIEELDKHKNDKNTFGDGDVFTYKNQEYLEKKSESLEK